MSLEKLSNDIRPGHMGTKSRVYRSEDNHDIVSRACGPNSAAHQYCAATQKARTGGSKDSKDGGNMPSVAKEVDNWTSGKRPVKPIQSSSTKRSHVSDNGMVETKDVPQTQSDNSLKVKSMPQGADMDPKNNDSGKSGIARRFSDAPAIVPIKKRRIQIAEVTRSPSPSRRPTSPQTQSSSHTSACEPSPPKSLSPSAQPRHLSSTSGVTSPSPGLSSKFTSTSQSSSISPSQQASVTNSRCSLIPSPSTYSQHSDPGLSSKIKPTLQSPSVSPSPQVTVCGSDTKEVTKEEFQDVKGLKVAGHCSIPSPSSHSQHSEQLNKNQSFQDLERLGVKGQGSIPLPSSQSQHSDQLNKKHRSGNAQLVIKRIEEFKLDTVEDLSEGCSDEVNEQSSQNQDRVIQDASPERVQEELPRSESGSLSKDDRLHWDLNTDMAAWDIINEQATSKNSEQGDGAETPYTSGSRDSDESPDSRRSHLRENSTAGKVDENPMSEEHINHKVLPQVDENPMSEDHINYKASPQVDKNPANEDVINYKSSQAEDCNSVEKKLTVLVEQNECGAVCNAESRDPVSWDGELICDGGEVNEKLSTLDEQDACVGRYSPLRSEKPVQSRCDETEAWNHMSEEPEAEEHVDYGDSDCRDADDVGLDGDDRTSLMQTESNWKVDDGVCNNESERHTQWEGDGMSDVDETLNKSSSQDDEHSDPSGERRARNRQSGWDKLPEGFDNAEEALKAVKELSSRRGGRTTTWTSGGGRGSLSSSHASGRFGPGQGNTRDRFSSGRTDGYFGDRHGDEARDREDFKTGRRLDDSFRGRNVVRRPGMFGRGRVSGWVDNQVGPMNQWGPGRHRPSGFGGPTNASPVGPGRVENSGFVVAPDGSVAKAGNVIVPGRGPIRPMVSGNRAGRGAYIQVGRGPVDMEAGLHYPMRAGMGTDRMNGTARGLGPGSGPGILGGMHDRNGSAGRGLIDRYRSGGMESRRSESPRRSNHRLDHPNFVGRIPSMRPESRIVRSRTPPSSHRSLGHSEYASTRGHYSPPPKWNVDKREIDNHRDRDMKRSVSRSRVPSQRTSPHVVHGSSLMDDRDRQVLAGTRHSPSLKGPSGAVCSGKPADGSSDGRRARRSEEEDVKHSSSHLKDGDHGRLSPRDSDKDRDKGSSYRRDRERDDDRRREPHRLSSKDDRTVSGHKHASTREADDDVAPRRRRPSS